MSQPTRYDAADLRCKKCQKNVEVLGVLRSHDEGRFVMWDDYVALKAETVRQIETALPSLEAYIGKLEAEVERLTKERDHYQWASTNDGIACNERAKENQDLENQIAALKAENERMRKAGNAMYQSLYRVAVRNDEMLPSSCDAWSFAKHPQP